MQLHNGQVSQKQHLTIYNCKKRNSEARQNKNIDITLANKARNKKKHEIQ